GRGREAESGAHQKQGTEPIPTALPRRRVSYNTGRFRRWFSNAQIALLAAQKIHREGDLGAGDLKRVKADLVEGPKSNRLALRKLQRRTTWKGDVNRSLPTGTGRERQNFSQAKVAARETSEPLVDGKP